MIIETQPWHIMMLCGEMPQGLVISFFNNTLAFTVMNETGLPIGIGGINTLMPGVGEAWTIITDELRSKPILLHKSALVIMSNFIESQRFHRIQCIVLENLHKAIKWMRPLGFLNEGLMQKYSIDQKNYWRYARVT